MIECSKELKNLPTYDKFNEEYENYSDGLVEKYLKKVSGKEMTIYEAEIKVHEETWDYLSKKYDIKYSFERKR